MRIGVLSDTHLHPPSGGIGAIKHRIRNKRSLEDLALIVEQHFSDVELILHAGDFVDEAVLNMLQSFAPVEAVGGNMDPISLRNRLPAQQVLQFAGFSIGLIHGEGAPQGILDRIRAHFNNVDAIVFGHTHQAMNTLYDGILFFNPGSPTDRIFASYNSIGILEITDRIWGEIIRI
jgi:putative phosphoesterase